jgi:hypothetical protein
VAWAASDGAPPPWYAPAAVVQAGVPPPSIESVWDALARRIDSDALLGGDGSVSGQNKIYLGHYLLGF